MPYIAPEVIAEAKKMDLLTYLENYEPYELVRFSNHVYKTKSFPNLKISNGKWCLWNDNGDPGEGGRSALDYLIKLRNMKFTDAVEQIMGRTATHPPVFLPQRESPPKKLVLPQRYRNTDRVEKYLANRGIGSEIIRHCIRSGLIYESAPYHNAVFVGLDKNDKPKYATLRGINTSFKGEAMGSDKRYAFGLSPSDGSDTAHFFEGAIDALSYETIQQIDGKPLLQDYLWTLGGVYVSKKSLEEKKLPDAITQFFNNHPNIKRVVLHLDNDAVGRTATKSIMNILADRCAVCDQPPASGKDYNDYLCNLLGLSRAKPKEKER